MCASIVGHPPLTSYLAIADGESIGRIKFEMTEVRRSDVRSIIRSDAFLLTLLTLPLHCSECSNLVDRPLLKTTIRHEEIANLLPSDFLSSMDRCISPHMELARIQVRPYEAG